ncbi:MAG: phosphoribosylaminoimidazolesuccinocarboxamide synthase [candidate division KSB1 bacterium]|nr:phosphoribosylaminoimidazolesuccinocarboxamide synthase [candidate division KSB1 bacterium]
MAIKKKKKLFEGKTKILYETENPEQIIMEFKDNGPSTNGSKKSKAVKRSAINNQISAHLFRYLESFNVPTHFMSQVSESAMLVRRLQIIPLEVMVRNIATGSFCKRYGLKEGEVLEKPIVEYFMKHTTKDDQMVNQHHIVAFGLATADELKMIERYVTKANAVLKAFFIRRGLRLVDFKLEFGRYKTHLLVGDELSVENCRLWDSETGEKFDAERLRSDASALDKIYEEVRRRVFIQMEGEKV